MIFSKLLFQTDVIISLVFWILLIMSVISWALIITKTSYFFKLEKKLKILFLENNDRKELIAKLADFLPKNIENVIESEEKTNYLIKNNLRYGMTTLATIGSCAPFIGLFGTVWGIYYALMDISKMQTASIDVVAGPMGEALIATALGLFAAIPAVMAFNFFKKNANEVSQKMQLLFYGNK